MSTRRLLPVVALVAALAGCSNDAAGDQLPGGTFAGSTATDRAFTLEITKDEARINNRKARFVDQGVLELRDADVPTTLTCKVLDEEGEELRCTLRTEPEDGGPTTEVIDLMLL